MIKVAGYVRVSTEGQAEEGYSIAAQEEAIKREAYYRGYELVDIYHDKGISGKSVENRLGLLRLIEDGKNGKFKMVIVWKISRLSRSLSDLSNIHQEFEKYEIDIKSITEPFDTSTPVGKMVFNLLGAIGEFERETTIENVKNGMRQRAKEGGFNGGRMIGYQSVFIEGSDRRKLVIVDNEAEIIRLIFDLYINGKGYKAIANKLNTLKYKTVRGNAFNIQSVRDVVMNPTYAGYVRYNNYVNHSKKRRKGSETEMVITEGTHEAIIDRETWEKAKSIFNSRTGMPEKRRSGVFLLTGLLKCPDCGSSMVAGRVKKKSIDENDQYHLYYQCSRYKNYGSSECKPNSIRADYAENYIIDLLNQFSFEQRIIEKVIIDINKHINSSVSPILEQIESLEKELQAVDSRKEKILRLYEDGIIDKDTLQNRISKINSEVEAAIEARKELNNEISEVEMVKEIPPDRIKELVKSIGSLLEIADRNQIKRLLNMIIDKIEVNDKREIKLVKFRFKSEHQKILLEESSNEDSSLFMPFSFEYVCQ